MSNVVKSEPSRPSNTASNRSESIINYQVDYARLVPVTSNYVETNKVAVAMRNVVTR